MTSHAHSSGAPASAAHRRPLVPFRWDVTRREGLGRLLDGPPADAYAEFADDLRSCCAAVVAAAARLAGPAGEPDLFFVGRSPESLFDYLRGLCRGTGWAGRLHVLHFSMRGDAAVRHVRRQYPAGLSALRAYFAALGLDPASLVARGRPAVFVDLVCNGETFGNLVRLLRGWCVERGVAWHAARRNVGLVRLTEREPAARRGHRRWPRDGPAVDCLERWAARSVPIPERLWGYLGDVQPMVAESYPLGRWGREGVDRPFRSADHAPALRLARRLYEAGLRRDERRRFVAELAGARGLRLPALLSLASQMRGTRREWP